LGNKCFAQASGYGYTINEKRLNTKLRSMDNQTFKNMDAVENTLVDALVALENDHNRVQHLTGFHWIVNDIMNAT
jgi:hypothetical protein